ncbi:MAG: hypothetical protein H6937_06240 [Burkholderiales bacterium]|nr:hypothetical protein [Burkholderiales bacterium]MDR4515941.1 hypothetical protein [Nitrosomonas sp.]
MSIEHDLDVSLTFDSNYDEDTIMENELVLIQSILPELLQDIMIQTEINKE